MKIEELIREAINLYQERSFKEIKKIVLDVRTHEQLFKEVSQRAFTSFGVHIRNEDFNRFEGHIIEIIGAVDDFVCIRIE